MPLISEALSTLANVKEALKITDASQDSLLTSLLNRVTGWIEDTTHRKLVARNYNGKGTAFSVTSVPSEDYIYLNGSQSFVNDAGYGELYLPVYPIQRTGTDVLTFNLAVLQNRSNALGEVWDSSSVLEYDSYILDAESGVIHLYGPAMPGYRNYKVTCTAGLLYPATPAAPWVPPDLESLCIELCKQMFRESRNVVSERISEWSRTYKLDVPDPHNKDILDKYSRPIV